MVRTKGGPRRQRTCIRADQAKTLDPLLLRRLLLLLLLLPLLIIIIIIRPMSDLRLFTQNFRNYT
jgi:hypothetical protein